MIDPMNSEYLFGRVYLPGLDSLVLGPRDDEVVFKTYAASRKEGIDFAAQLMALGLEIQTLAEDIRDFVKTYESEKWED